MGQQLVATAQHATDVGTYLYMILARRFGAHQRVVSDDVAHIQLGNPDAGSHFADHGLGKIADLILSIEQHGDQGRAKQGIKRHHAVKARGQGGTEDGLYLCAHSCCQACKVEPQIPPLRFAPVGMTNLLGNGQGHGLIVGANVPVDSSSITLLRPRWSSQSMTAVSSSFGPIGKVSVPSSSIRNAPHSSRSGWVTHQFPSPVSELNWMLSAES